MSNAHSEFRRGAQQFDQKQWIASLNVSGSYQQATPLLAATTDLTNGLKTDHNTGGYGQAIGGDLHHMSQLPDAMLTPDQQTEFTNDASALDGFFGTPGLYSNLFLKLALAPTFGHTDRLGLASQSVGVAVFDHDSQAKRPWSAALVAPRLVWSPPMLFRSHNMPQIWPKVPKLAY